MKLVMVHLQVIDLHQRFGASGDNAVLRSNASEMIPALSAHLQAAQSLRIAAPPAYRPPPRAGERG